jgi:hypothetical protein
LLGAAISIFGASSFIQSRELLATIQRDFGPINLQSGEIFKIRGGKIHEVEANGFLLPYGASTGWE